MKFLKSSFKTCTHNQMQNVIFDTNQQNDYNFDAFSRWQHYCPAWILSRRCKTYTKSKISESGVLCEFCCKFHNISSSERNFKIGQVLAKLQDIIK